MTLGWKEKDDLLCVIDYLKGLGTVSEICLWGRSMGAATAIMYMAENAGAVKCAILDSSFSTFQKVVDHIALEQMQIPE